MGDLDVMGDVLRKEARAIETLASSLNDKHKKMVDICGECKGKVVITGMGKSGHIAKKISATMASLGKPAFYLHPGEAAHGDLGMVERRDVVILISKSGETDEIMQLIPSLKIIGCKLIGLFCKQNSTLEKHCDLTIVLPMEEEACINNLAPTTSTTMTMAFGDAVAVALSARNHFGRNEFALFHPKGSLGKQLLLAVDDLANKNDDEVLIYPGDSIRSVLWHITKNRIGAVAVVDEKKHLIGLISDGDVRRAMESNDDIFEKNAADIMTIHPVFVNKKLLAVEAFKIMSEKKISVLPIVDDNNMLAGIVGFHDIVASGIGEK